MIRALLISLLLTMVLFASAQENDSTRRAIDSLNTEIVLEDSVATDKIPSTRKHVRNGEREKKRRKNVKSTITKTS